MVEGEEEGRKERKREGYMRRRKGEIGREGNREEEREMDKERGGREREGWRESDR